MKSMIFSLAWKDSLLSIINIFGFGAGVRGRKKPLLRVYHDESNLRRAMLTIRMALNPGETLNADVAARIRREAAAYEEFLRNPTRVGRIVLNVKEFAGLGAVTCVSREQYRINQPLEGLNDSAEGRASVWYRFARSRDKVLEFIVHDENDKPLFPLVRSYTNWIVAKELDLGLNRKFYLTLSEGEPGYVNVRAGFTPASAAEEVANPVPRQQPRAVAAGAGVGNTISPSGSPSYSLAFREPANAIGFSVVLLVMLLSTLLFVQQLNMRDAKANVDTNPARVSGALPGAGALAAPQIRFAGGDASQSLAADLRTVLPAKKETLLRLADIRRFKVSVDKKSCQGRCLKLLNGIQRQLKSRLDGLNLPPVAPESVAVKKPSASLVVSYLPLDAERGNIHITLSDDESSLWNFDHYFDHGLSGDAQIPDSYCEQLSAKVLLTVFRAKDHCLSAADGGLLTK